MGSHEPGEQTESTARYRVRRDDLQAFISCSSVPNVRLHVERGLSVSKTERKRYPRQTIFLDGAYADAPFADNQLRQYSLDHHTGCVRPFTLASCEQAVVMLLQGLPLDEGEWFVYLNEPDLDAVLGAWVLFNHAELLADGRRLLHDAMPLIRVEGVIDAHGFDMVVLSALPPEHYRVEKARIDGLREREATLRAAGEWGSVDALEYTVDLLQRIDGTLYPEGFLAARVQVEEIAELPLKERKLAVLCRSQSGIYEAEAQLKQRFGKALALIILDQGDQRFTLRQVDTFLSKNLEHAYPQLNRADPRVQEAEPGDNTWGGSAEIGGSPRGTGSALSGRHVLAIVQRVYTERPNWLRRFFGRS